MSKRTQRAAFIILLIIFLLSIVAEMVDAQDAAMVPDAAAVSLTFGEHLRSLKVVVPDGQTEIAAVTWGRFAS